jgi:hypothetical protein
VLCHITSSSASWAELRHVLRNTTNCQHEDSDQLQCHALLYTVSRGSTSGWCDPCTPLSQILLVLQTFLASFPMFHNFIQLFPSLPLFLNLQPTSRTSSFILRSPTIKTHVHRQPKRTSLPLRTAQTSYQKTHLKLCILLVRLCILSHFVAFRTLLLFALCCFLHFVAFCTLSPISLPTSLRAITRHRSSSLLISSRCVKSDSLRNPLIYIIHSFLIHLIGC